MAHISGDEAPCCAPSTRGLDVHRATAAEVFGVALGQVTSEQRRYAKVINFGLIYGNEQLRPGEELRSTTRPPRTTSTATPALPRVARYMQDTKHSCRAATSRPCSAGVCTCPRSIPNGPRRRSAAERAAINAPMQATAADPIKKAIQVQDALDAAKPEVLHDHAGARRTLSSSCPRAMRTTGAEVPRIMAGGRARRAAAGRGGRAGLLD